MKSWITKFCSVLAIALCLNLVWSSIPVYGMEEGRADSSNEAQDTKTARDKEQMMDLMLESEQIDHTYVDEEIRIVGLEGIKIKEIMNVELPRTKSSCGIFHVWTVTSVIQEGRCDKEGIYKVRCSTCGATGTVTTDAPGHKYVNGICSVCGEQRSIDVAPDAELAKWTYDIDENKKTISLRRYMDGSSDVIVYGAYKVNGTIYNTIFDSYGWASSPFSDCRKLIETVVIKDGVISYNCNSLFYLMENLTYIDVTGLDTSNVKNMSRMFCGKYTLNELDLSNLDTSNVTDMSEMFGWSTIHNLDVSKFDTTNVTNMSQMFSDFDGTDIDLRNFDTSKVTRMHAMFSGYKRMTLDVSSFDTSNVTDMSLMFSGYDGIELDITNFNTSKVMYMDSMFNSFDGTELDLSNFDTSNVTNMRMMFINCFNLKELDFSKFNTSKVVNMNDMFTGCTSLTTLDLTSFDTSYAETMVSMFRNCRNLNVVYVSRAKWNTSFADTTDMFGACKITKVTPK